MVSEKQMARLLDLANLACQKGLVGEARTIFQAVLALRPGFAPALVGLAFSHVVVDDFDTALTILDQVLADNAADADALAMRGLACLLAGRRGDAEQGLCRHSAGLRCGRYGPGRHGSRLTGGMTFCPPEARRMIPAPAQGATKLLEALEKLSQWAGEPSGGGPSGAPVA